MDRKPTGLASPLTHCRLYMRRRRLISTDKRKDFEDARINWTGVQGSPDVQPNAPCTSLVNRRDDDAEKDLDGQACKGRGRLHHQGVVGRLWVGGALGLGGGQLGASSGQGATAGWRGPKLPDSSRLPAASRDHLGRWQRITKWSPATSSSTKWRHRCPSCCHHVASTTINNTIG